MADLAAADVTVDNTYYAGFGKQIKHQEVTVTLATMGTVVNAIPAAAMGLTEFRGISELTKSDDLIVLLGFPSYDKSQLLLRDAATNAPADYSGTFKGIVTGY